MENSDILSLLFRFRNNNNEKTGSADTDFLIVSDTKCGIERDDLLIILTAEVFRRELDGVSRLVGIHVDPQALGLGVICGLDLNGNELPVTLNDKINFSSTLGLPIVGAVAVDGKLHIDMSDRRRCSGCR